MSEQLTTSNGTTLDSPRYGETIEVRLGARRRLTSSQFATATRTLRQLGGDFIRDSWLVSLSEGRCDSAIADLIRRGDAVVTYAD